MCSLNDMYVRHQANDLDLAIVDLQSRRRLLLQIARQQLLAQHLHRLYQLLLCVLQNAKAVALLAWSRQTPAQHSSSAASALCAAACPCCCQTVQPRRGFRCYP